MNLNQIPTFEDSRALVDFKLHAEVPDDWFMFCTDVKTSTDAIRSGRYKEVNAVGASGIIAVLNAVNRAPIPYVFGGDGATFLVPPQFAEATRVALLATQALARRGFGLELRVGKVAVAELRKSGGPVRVARVRVAGELLQTVLSGPGVALAEEWVKRGEAPNRYLCAESVDSEAGNFTGLECRWKPVKSAHGDILSVVLQARGEGEAAHATYARVLAEIEKLYGGHGFVSPIRLAGLKLSHRLKSYDTETRIRAHRLPLPTQLKYRRTIYAVTVLFSFLWATLFRRAGNAYKTSVVRRADFLKFDGSLKFVVDSKPEQTRRLAEILEKESLAGELIYGIHRSSEALLTCLIFERAQGDHVHFVDGAEGGYALAATSLKSKRADFCAPAQRVG